MRKKKIEEKLLALIIFGLFVVSFLVIVSAQDDVQSSVEKFFDKKPVRYFIGVVFGLWEPDNVIESFNQTLGPVTKVGAIIAYIALWLALLLSFGNIIGIFNPTSEWVGWIVGILLAIAAAQLKLVFWLISTFAVLTAWLGAFSVFASIVLSFVAFFLLSIGTETIRKWAVKRKLAIETVKAMKGTHRVKTGIKSLGEIGEEVEKAGGL